tara:strand:- start:201 stop:1130 length:930 start_codon:yes stop_codon:yes gene_type:complete
MYKLGVLGKNISYSQSPYIHKAFAKHAGIDIQYEIFDISEDPLSFVDRFFADGGHGLNVTTPYKTSFPNFMHSPVNLFLKSPDAPKYIAKNVDADGFYEDLRSKGLRSCGNHRPVRSFVNFEEYERVINGVTKVLIMGLGGAGLAIAQSNEMQRHVTSGGKGTDVQVWNRTNSKIQQVEEVWTKGYFGKKEPSFVPWQLEYNPLLEDGGSHRSGSRHTGLLISCASKIDKEMLNIISNINWSPNSKYIYDINYNNKTNDQLSKIAEEVGAKFISGEGMLVEQAALSFEHWFEHQVPQELKEEIKQRIKK